MKKIGLFFGGMGNEAEVSCMSAKNVADNLDTRKYVPVLVYWHTDGSFYRANDFSRAVNKNRRVREEELSGLIDIALPMTHGRFGEDGILQAIFEKNRIKYCGCRVLSSALCMDKAVCKIFLSGQGVPQTDFTVLNLADLSKVELKKELAGAKRRFRLPVFVKPSNSGSSVGITKVTNYAQLPQAVKDAGRHDAKIVIEAGLVDPTEIEVGVLGNDKLKISQPGKLILAKDFYDYDDKYFNNQTGMEIPARIPAAVGKEITRMAEKVYRLCDCRGFARIDFFYANKRVYLNEINTLPGFTKISMYPMLMINTGLSYKQLITKIIELA